MSTLKKVISFVALFLVATLVLGTFGVNSVRAVDESTYYVCSAATSSSIYKVENGIQEAYDDFVYCSDIDKSGPNLTVNYAQGLLSSSELDAETRSRLMVILMDRAGIQNKISEIAATYPYAQKYWDSYSGTSYAYQHFVWIILSEDKFFARHDGYGYDGITQAMTGAVDNKDDADSFWKSFFVPVRDFIISESSKYPVGSGEGQYDAYFYHPSNDSYQRLLGKGWYTPVTKGSLVITKTIEGDVTDEDLKGLTFTVTDSNGKEVGSYLLGQDFTYDDTTGLYTKELTGLDSALTYTVEETLYTITGTTVTVTYQIGGGSTESGTTADVTITAGQTTTVAYTDSYKKIVTTTPAVTTTPSSTTETTPSVTNNPSTVVVSGKEETPSTTTTGTTDPTTPSESAAVKDSAEDTTSTTATPTAAVVSGTSDNTTSDSPKTTTTSGSGTVTDSTEETAAANKTTTAPQKTDRATTTSVTKTGEAISYTLIAGIAVLFASCVLFTVRERKFKNN